MKCPCCEQETGAKVMFDHGTGVLTCGDAVAHFTPQQSDIFYLLWEKQFTFIHKAQIVARVCGSFNDDFCEDTLAVQVCLMRRKLRGSGVRIENRYGEGYRVAA